MNNYVGYGNPGRTGYEKYGINDLSVARKVILLPPGTTIANAATAKLQATWTALAKNPFATRAFPFPLAVECKPSGGTTIMAKTALSGDVPIREEVSSIALSYVVNPILAAELRKCNFKKWDVILIDAFDNIIGWTPDGTKLKGLTTTSVFFGQMAHSDGSKARENELMITFANPKEFNDNPFIIMGSGLDWYPTQLDGTTGVKMTITASVGTGFTVSVNAAGMDVADPRGAYVGLAKADFVVTKDGNSFSLSAATMTDNGDGTYTFVVTCGTGVYIVSLVTAANNSVVAYNIEASRTGTFTI